VVLLLLACAAPSSADANGDVRRGRSSGDTGDTAAVVCDDDVVACVDHFPFEVEADTREGERHIDTYACSPDSDESGPELEWRVDVPAPGFLSAVVVDDADAGVDVDLHLLRALDGERCIQRGNFDVGVDVEAGSYYLVADSYVSGGAAQAGAFSLRVDFLEPNEGDCSVQSGSMRRVGDGGEALPMPATGPIVMEAHLVAVDDGYGADRTDPWPQTAAEGLAAHHGRGADDTRLAMHREQVWAPQEGCEYG
jgi:hypothetical protein